MSNSKVDFSNTKVAFHLKTDAELERAYFLFKMISNEPLVRIGTAATNFALKTHLPVEGLIRATVFDHFCAKYGFHKDDVTDVFLTHLHFDHCGGGVEWNLNKTGYQLISCFI